MLKTVMQPLFPSSVRYGDIVAGLPIPDGSVKGLYASHVLEHLYRDELLPALANSIKILEPGAIFRLIVPDLAWRARVYMERADASDDHAADDLLDSTLLGQRKAPKRMMNGFEQPSETATIAGCMISTASLGC